MKRVREEEGEGEGDEEKKISVREASFLRENLFCLIGRIGKAIRKGEVEEVRELVSINTEEKINLDHCLLLAVEKDRTEIVRILLEAGVKMDPPQKCLQVAICRSNLKMVKVLLEAGEDPKPTRWGSPLRLALLRSKTLEIADALIAAGAGVNDKELRGNTLFTSLILELPEDRLEYLISNGADFDKPDAYGDTPLVKAVRGRKAALVSFLLAKGANPNQRTREGEPIVMMAIREGTSKMVYDLLNGGASLHQRNVRGDAPIIEAVRRDKIGIFEKLSRIMRLDKVKKRLILYFAASQLSPGIVKSFLKRGVSIDQKDSTGRSLLECAIRSPNYLWEEYSVVMRMLNLLVIEFGADINEENSEREPLLNRIVGDNSVSREALWETIGLGGELVGSFTTRANWECGDGPLDSIGSTPISSELPLATEEANGAREETKNISNEQKTNDLSDEELVQYLKKKLLKGRDTESVLMQILARHRSLDQAAKLLNNAQQEVQREARKRPRPRPETSDGRPSRKKHINSGRDEGISVGAAPGTSEAGDAPPPGGSEAVSDGSDAGGMSDAEEGPEVSSEGRSAPSYLNEDFNLFNLIESNSSLVLSREELEEGMGEEEYDEHGRRQLTEEEINKVIQGDRVERSVLDLSETQSDFMFQIQKEDPPIKSFEERIAKYEEGNSVGIATAAMLLGTLVSSVNEFYHAHDPLISNIGSCS